MQLFCMRHLGPTVKCHTVDSCASIVSPITECFPCVRDYLRNLGLYTVTVT